MDLVEPDATGRLGRAADCWADLAARAAEQVAAGRPVIFHLAAVVSGQAEADFDHGYRVNLDGTRAARGDPRRGRRYRPRLVFSSSIAVFGAPLPDVTRRTSRPHR